MLRSKKQPKTQDINKKFENLLRKKIDMSCILKVLDTKNIMLSEKNIITSLAIYNTDTSLPFNIFEYLDESLLDEKYYKHITQCGNYIVFEYFIKNNIKIKISILEYIFKNIRVICLFLKSGIILSKKYK